MHRADAPAVQSVPAHTMLLQSQLCRLNSKCIDARVLIPAGPSLQVKNLLYLFVGGVTGVLLWKI